MCGRQHGSQSKAVPRARPMLIIDAPRHASKRHDTPSARLTAEVATVTAVTPTIPTTTNAAISSATSQPQQQHRYDNGSNDVVALEEEISRKVARCTPWTMTTKWSSRTAKAQPRARRRCQHDTNDAANSISMNQSMTSTRRHPRTMSTKQRGSTLRHPPRHHIVTVVCDQSGAECL